MKIINKILVGLLTTIMFAGLNACSEEFLDEELTTKYALDHLQTEEGINQLAIALYGNLRYHFAYEWAYGFTNYGTDEYSTGTDLTSEMWNTYDSRLAPYVTGGANKNFPAPESFWDAMYYGINNANLLIANADIITNTDLRDKAKGEGYFLRGYNYLRLAEQFGGVVLNLETKFEVVRNYTRSSVEDVVNQIVKDLSDAYGLLPEEEFRGKGTFTKPLAAHMLAKALLFRCSERNDDWNSSYKSVDLDRIIELTDYVIITRPLAVDYRDLWNWTGIDCAAEMLPEVLMTAQFNGDKSTSGRYKNRTFCYPIAQYSNLPYMTRTVAGGLDFQRLRTSEYSCNVYDRVNDSRFWKSFKTKYRINKATADNEYGLENGDLGVIYIVNNITDTRFIADSLGNGSFYYVDTNTNKVVPNAFINYANGEFVAQKWGNNRFVSLSKYEDGSRTALKDNGNRDGILARTGETYLIKAEALVRQGKYMDAISEVNKLRTRAQYVDGEAREYHTDGSQTVGGSDKSFDAYSNVNSYYESNNVAYTIASTDLQIASPANLPQVDEDILAKLGVSGDYNRMLHFILNERSRELNGEFLRWVDLSRTKTLVLRAKTFNAEAAANVKDYHCLRPIPQAFIDDLANEDGSNLSPEVLEKLQNPGY